MAITTVEAQELVESVFDFDHFDSIEAQEALVEELVHVALEELDNASEDNKAIITTAARTRVGEFVKGAKFSQSGCSGL
jgi:hypothetical protein